MTTPVTAAESLVERLVAEGLIGMSAAAKLFGSYRNNRPTHTGTLSRHCLHGVQLPDGQTLRLEHLRVAGRLMTSRAAVLRFLAAQQQGTPLESDAVRTPDQRRREGERAAEALKRIGV